MFESQHVFNYTPKLEPSLYQWELYDLPGISFKRPLFGDVSGWEMVITKPCPTEAIAAIGLAGIPFSQPINQPLRELVSMLASVIGCSSRLRRGSMNSPRAYVIGDTGFRVAKCQSSQTGKVAWNISQSLFDSTVPATIIPKVMARCQEEGPWSTRQASLDALKRILTEEIY